MKSKIYPPGNLRLFTSCRSNDEQFSTELVERLVERLEEEQLPNLTLNEQQSLVVLIQATLAVSTTFMLLQFTSTFRID